MVEVTSAFGGYERVLEDGMFVYLLSLDLKLIKSPFSPSQLLLSFRSEAADSTEDVFRFYDWCFFHGPPTLL